MGVGGSNGDWENKGSGQDYEDHLYLKYGPNFRYRYTKFHGKPNTTNVTQDGAGNKRETHIGPDGWAKSETHHTDHGHPKNHPYVPHRHDIEWIEGAPRFGPDLPMN